MVVIGIAFFKNVALTVNILLTVNMIETKTIISLYFVMKLSDKYIRYFGHSELFFFPFRGLTSISAKGL